jgi:hypothetical protein
VRAAADTPTLDNALVVKEAGAARLSAADAQLVVLRGGHKEAAV